MYEATRVVFYLPPLPHPEDVCIFVEKESSGLVGTMKMIVDEISGDVGKTIKLDIPLPIYFFLYTHLILLM